MGTALGYTTQTTIVAWLMATLTPSALMVALVQTASTAPSLLLGLFAGALADLVDRRRVILVTQIILLLATTSLGAATLLGAMTPATLLAFTFVIGAGFTFYMPAQLGEHQRSRRARRRAARGRARRGRLQRRARSRSGARRRGGRMALLGQRAARERASSSS